MQSICVDALHCSPAGFLQACKDLAAGGLSVADCYAHMRRLSGGDIAGIVIGSVVGVALLAAAAAIALRARQRRSASRV